MKQFNVNPPGLLLRLLPAALLAGSLFLAGCSKDDSIVDPPGEQPPPGVTDESSAMEYYAANDEYSSNSEQTIDDGDAAAAEYGAGGGLAGDLMPLRFGRIIRSVTKHVELEHQPGDTLAVATVTKDILGVFRIRGIDEGGDTVALDKQFHDRSQVKVIFRRVQDDSGRFWRNWIPVARSLVAGGTVPPDDDIAVQKVEAFLANGDTVVVTDPLATFLRYRWLRLLGVLPVLLHPDLPPVPELEADQQLTMRVTVRSSSPDTDLVALRFGCDFYHRSRLRMQLVSETDNGDGTFTRVYERMWRVPALRGFFHVAVDAMTRGTIFSDTEPYSVSWWGVPYRVF